MSRARRWAHAWPLAYLPVFLLWFFALEARAGGGEVVMHHWLDDVIPFREEFVVPYLAWFPYVLGFVGWLVVRDAERRDFRRLAWYLISGLTVCLVTYTFWPNTQLLRPEVYPRDNALTALVAALQGFDTPTNVAPSMHVYASLAVNHVVWTTKHIAAPWVRWTSVGLLVAISASTVFLKQHSVVDVAWAVALYAAVWGVTRVSSRAVRSSRARRAVPAT